MAARPHAAADFVERPLPLKEAALLRRIYAPEAYAKVRDLAVVPVVHSECAALANWFALAWRRRADGSAEFVTLRALLSDQEAQPAPARRLLPLALRAYPFVLDPEDSSGAHSRRMLDDVFADAPTDIGATVTTHNGQLSRGSLSRLRFLDQFAQEIELTQAISDRILSLDALEAWPLEFDVAEGHISMPDLMVIRPSVFESGALAPLLQQFGLPCATILTMHRISLFRAGGLLTAARQALARAPERPDLLAAEPRPADALVECTA